MISKKTADLAQVKLMEVMINEFGFTIDEAYKSSKQIALSAGSSGKNQPPTPESLYFKCGGCNKYQEGEYHKDEIKNGINGDFIALECKFCDGINVKDIQRG